MRPADRMGNSPCLWNCKPPPRSCSKLFVPERLSIWKPHGPVLTKLRAMQGNHEVLHCDSCCRGSMRLVSPMHATMNEPMPTYSQPALVSMTVTMLVLRTSEALALHTKSLRAVTRRLARRVARPSAEARRLLEVA